MPNPWNQKHRGHRWVFCPNCEISMNRDANAGQNMHQNGLRQKRLLGRQPPAPTPRIPNRRARALPQPPQVVPPVQQQGSAAAALVHQPRDRPATQRRKSCFHQ